MIQNKRRRNVVIALFVIYMLCLIKLIMFKFYNMTVISIFFHEWSCEGVIENIKRANLIPIVTTYDVIFNTSTSDALYYGKVFVYNIMAFLPFGAMLPLLFSKMNTWKKVLLATFLLSFTFELLQIVTILGVFDIDDLILNTLGGLIGYGLIRLIAKK